MFRCAAAQRRKWGNMGKINEKTLIMKIVDLENEIDAAIDALVDLKRDIIQVINQVGNSEYRLLLEKRYLRCEPWEEIAVAMQYSLRYIHKLHGEALKVVFVPAEK